MFSRKPGYAVKYEKWDSVLLFASERDANNYIAQNPQFGEPISRRPVLRDEADDLMTPGLEPGQPSVNLWCDLAGEDTVTAPILFEDHTIM